MVKKVLVIFPEYYLIILALLAAYKQSAVMTVILLSIAVILILQIIFQSRAVGLLLAVILILINIFFLGALISEFSEFRVINDRTVNLLLVGIPLLALNFLAGGVMIYKYGYKSDRSEISKNMI